MTCSFVGHLIKSLKTDAIAEIHEFNIWLHKVGEMLNLPARSCFNSPKRIHISDIKNSSWLDSLLSTPNFFGLLRKALLIVQYVDMGPLHPPYFFSSGYHRKGKIVQKLNLLVNIAKKCPTYA